MDLNVRTFMPAHGPTAVLPPLSHALAGGALLLLAAVAVAACAGGDPSPPPPSSGIDLLGMDPSVAPGEDFYRHVNGRWLEETTIPADRAVYGAFVALADQAEERVRVIVEAAAAAGAPPGSTLRKVGDLYRSFMDEEGLEALGVEPLRPLLARIGEVEDHEGFLALWGELSRAGVAAPTAVSISVDPGQPDRYVGFLSQSGLGLPNRDFYTSDSPPFPELREAYREHVARTLALAELPDPEGAARRVLELETRLARAQWTPVENRDAQRTYNPTDLSSLEARTRLPWGALVGAAGVDGSPTYVVRQPSYLEALPSILRSTPVATWREYQQFRVISAFSPFLSRDFVEENFDFYGRRLQGTEEIRPRWKRGVSAVEAGMGEAVGELYVERHFPPEAGERMDALVGNLLRAFRGRLQLLEWMSDETKVRALEKLERFETKIGHPEVWRDYSALEIDAEDLVGNAIRWREFERDRQAARLGGAVDRGEWFMTPQTVNAYYAPSLNEIVFPAAILEPPFFDLAADEAVNYGAIGAVIGHEITHGFDDQGSRYGPDGSLTNWWTDADREAFEALAARLVAQYDGYCPLEGHCIQGALSLGENIADLGGLTVAYDAYRLSLRGEEAPIIDGLTGDQRFFMGWAQVWRTLQREESLINQLRTGPHAPGEFRTNGVVVNVPAFHEAFGLGRGDPMYSAPEERIRIW